MNQADYPALFQANFWFGNTDIQFELCDVPPDDALIANVNVVGYHGDKWLMLRAGEDDWTLAGGTRELNEPVSMTASRELYEEAGAILKNMRPVGAWRCYSRAETPYRSHMPHPLFYRYVVMGEVDIVGAPTNPPDAEQITVVEFMPLEKAVERFLMEKRYDLADLYRLAAVLRASG